MNSTKPQCPLAPGTTFRHVHDWNTIPDPTPLMYSTQTDIHSRSSINANDGTAQTYRQFYRQLAFPAMTISDLQRREAVVRQIVVPYIKRISFCFCGISWVWDCRLICRSAENAAENSIRALTGCKKRVESSEQYQVFEDEILPGTESADHPREEMPE